MSALTKVFVVLVVILAIIETAGVTVFVNRQQSFAKLTDNLKSRLQAAQADAAAARDQVALADTSKTQMQAQLQNQLNSSQQQIDSLRAAVTDKDTHIAQLEGNVAQLTAASKSAADALSVAQKQMGEQNTQLADLRKNLLDLQNRNSEQSFALNDWTNKYEVTNRQWRDALEQINQLQNDNKNLRETMHKAGVSETNPRDINPEPLIRLQGVVQSKENIGGVPMATISLGSGDQVTKGMQFRVVDPKNSQNPFLGYLIVDNVEPHQAIGHLTGPRVDEIHPGVEVRTQL